MNVTYTVNYDEHVCSKYPSLDCSTEPGAIELTVPNGVKGDEVMQMAADKDKKYEFTAKYYPKPLGFYVTTINKVEEAHQCYWTLYYKKPGATDYEKSKEGISNLQPSNGSAIKYLYQYYETAKS